MVFLAYLDPGSGSFIVQILIASLLGALVSIRLFWKRIGSWFGLNKTDDQMNSTDGKEHHDH